LRACSHGTPVVAANVQDGPVPPGVPWEQARNERPVEPSCTHADVQGCVVVRGSGPHIHLIGDSHAKTLLDLFTRMAEEHDLTFSATMVGACPWQRGLLYVDNELRTDRCVDQQADWYERVLPALHPDIVVLFQRGLDDPAFPRKMESLDPGLTGLDQATLLRRTAESTLDELVADHYRTVILEPLPIAPFDPTACLSGAATLGACSFRANDHPTPIEVVYRYASLTRRNVWSIDMDRLACPDLPICMPMVGGQITRRDSHHLTLAFAKSLAPGLFEELQRAGVFSGV